VTGGWRKLHIEELQMCFFHKIKQNEVSRTCNTQRQVINTCEVLFGKREGMRPHGRPKGRWEDVMDVKE
jgi:hypothetical protein